MNLAKKHRRSLQTIFERPTRANIRWQEIEQLFKAAGAEISEGTGSRVRIKLANQVKTFHRPHPAKEAKRYAVEAARTFLQDHRITPDEFPL
jgi:hypothetical protein